MVIDDGVPAKTTGIGAAGAGGAEFGTSPELIGPGVNKLDAGPELI
ncbi:hypothetical protein Tco_0604962, partial [Tanacetum coccineum]